MDITDDLEGKPCPKCGMLMIKQEIDETWFCESCDSPHGKEKPKDEEEISYKNCIKCGKDSGIFDLCVDCRSAK